MYFDEKSDKNKPNIENLIPKMRKKLKKRIKFWYYFLNFLFNLGDKLAVMSQAIV